MSDPVATVLERSSGALTRPSSGVSRGRKGDRVDREKMLEVTLQQIEKQHGKGAVMKLGEHPMNVGMTTIPTGSLALDIALGVGGIPRGRVVEVFGPEGSGKTTVCLHIIAEAQRQGGIAAFIDAEHALDPTYARELGVDIDELLVSQPDSGEQALEIADMLVRSGAMHLVVIDSVAARVPWMCGRQHIRQGGLEGSVLPGYRRRSRDRQEVRRMVHLRGRAARPGT